MTIWLAPLVERSSWLGNMPYIKQERRNLVIPADAGELNWKITQLIVEYLVSHGRYQGFNDVIGALECCKLEVYRRLIAPYEDEAKKRNGDVFQ